jgi:methylase of polypeptide subunit release factors
MTDRDEALVTLLHVLKQRDYRFVAVTPATHARVLARPVSAKPDLRDAFGWSRPFSEDDLPPDIVATMRRAGAIEQTAAGLVSTVRVASLGDDLFLHSRYPTDARDAVFFGPDTYRFAAFVGRALSRDAHSIVDLGTGSGAGGIVAARCAPQATVTLVDINPAALDLARVNARAAGVEARLVGNLSDAGAPDVIIANPPYIMDDAGRAYRDGGALLGGQVALDWAGQALAALRPGGTLLLYTGAAYVGGESPLLDALADTCRAAHVSLAIEEIDPDVFGEELERPAYADVERIAAIGAVIRKPG